MFTTKSDNDVQNRCRIHCTSHMFPCMLAKVIGTARDPVAQLEFFPSEDSLLERGLTLVQARARKSRGVCVTAVRGSSSVF